MVILDHRKHLSSLDGVRGVAILMVFCHHLCPFGADNPIGVLCSTLWLGVHLFFVLSGFLITGVLYDTLQQPSFFRNFYARRALRLLPVYAVVVALVLAVNALLCLHGPSPDGHPTVWALPYFAYASNVIVDLNRHGWQIAIGVLPQLDVSHFWSLAVEEQFYLLWPMAVFLAGRRRRGPGTRRRILWMCAAGTALSVVLRFFAAGSSHFALGTPYFELPMQLDSLLLGGAMAILLRSERGAGWLTVARLNSLLILGLLGLALSFAAARHGSMFTAPMVRYGYLAASIAFAAAIGLAAHCEAHRENWVQWVGSHRFLRTFGRCSYGLYLVHLVPRHWYYALLLSAKAQCHTRWERGLVGGVIFAVYLALCTTLARFSYATLESYFLRLKGRFAYSDERKLPKAAAAYSN